MHLLHLETWIWCTMNECLPLLSCRLPSNEQQGAARSTIEPSKNAILKLFKTLHVAPPRPTETTSTEDLAKTRREAGSE